MAELDNELDDDVYGAILDLNMGAVAKLECDWVGGPHACDVEHAKANFSACRTALEHVAALLKAKEHANG